MVQYDSLKNGLVACYRFSGNARDGYNYNDGIVYSAELTSDRFGRTGNAYSFNGINSYIQAPGANFNFDNNMSLSFWMNPSSTQNHWANLIDKSHCPGGQSGWTFVVDRDANNRYYFDYVQSPQNALYWYWLHIYTNDVQAIEVSSNSWTHFSVTKQDQYIKYYRNGQLVFEDRAVSASIKLNSGDLYIGKSFQCEQKYTGFLDDIYIYDRALTADEVSLLYNMPVTEGEKCFPSPSPSPSISPSSSPSSSSTISGSITISQTNSASVTSTISSTPTASPSLPVTPSISPSSTPSYSTTGTASSTATLSSIPSSSPSPSNTSSTVMLGGCSDNTLSYITNVSRVNIDLSANPSLGDTCISQNINLIGSRFNDQLGGNGYNNLIDGGDGNDLLFGGGGGDTLIGGRGADIFKIINEPGVTRIKDFDFDKPGERIDLSLWDGVTSDKLKFSYHAANTEILVNERHKIILEGIIEGDLSENDFVFSIVDDDDDSDGNNPKDKCDHNPHHYLEALIGVVVGVGVTIIAAGAVWWWHVAHRGEGAAQVIGLDAVEVDVNH